MTYSLPQKLLAEFIGTFALIFIGAGAGAVIGGGTGGFAGIIAIAFAHGLVILTFAYAYGAISGGHFNPAVTVGLLTAGEISVSDAVAYIVSQLVGGIVGGLLLLMVLGGAETGLGKPGLFSGQIGTVTVTVSWFAGFVIEAVLAFFLVNTILNTAVAGRGGDLAPVAIGFTLVLNIITGGMLTGAAFNPARALGPMVATGDFSNFILYMIAPLVGAVVAALLYKGVLSPQR